MPEALAALQSDAQVQVEAEGWLIFRPVGGERAVGLILYPGGRVDPRAYAPPARAIAAEGYLVVMVPMPLNLAFFGPDRAAEVMAAFPEVEHWAVGGHSLGEAMAARFAHGHPSAVQGLVLWASYPAASDDLSARELAVVSISGTRDGLATEEKIAASRSLLPAQTRWVTIEGEPLEWTTQACETCGRPVETAAMTLRSICTNALLTQQRAEANLPGEKKVWRYKLALQIANEDVIDLPPKDVATLQELVGKLYAALVVGQVWEMLDPKQE